MTEELNTVTKTLDDNKRLYTYLENFKFRDEFDPKMVVSNPNPIDTQMSKKTKPASRFSEDGILSEKIFGPEQEMENVDIMGWIDFEGIPLINPLHFERLSKLFRKSKFVEMISYDKNITANGKIIDYTEEEIEKSKDFPTKNIGLFEFKDRFLEILRDETRPELKNSKEYRTVLNAYLNDTLFTDCFPVFSPKLRPAEVNPSSKDFRFTEINTIYNFLIAHTNAIKEELADPEISFEENRLQILNLIFQAQMDLYQIVLYVIDNMLKEKSGFIRKNIIGSRINFSARNVITPEPNNGINEVSMNYITFARLYRPLLINLVYHAKHLDFNSAERYVSDRTTHFDPELYSYMNELVHKTEGGMHIILNRNPSISTSSINICRIKEVKPEFEDVTLGVSNNILAGLGADFDGDVLNIIALFNKKQVAKFDPIRPENQAISIKDGLFNYTYDLNKDQAKAVWDLNN